MTTKTYTTELVINADDSEVVRVKDHLTEISRLLSQIGGRGVAPGGVGVPGAPAPGSSTPPPVSGGAGFMPGGPGSAGGAPVGGGGGGGGRFQRPRDMSPPTTAGGIVTGAMASAAGLIGLGALGAALGRDFVATSERAIAFDEAESRTRGLLGGRMRARGEGRLGVLRSGRAGARMLGFDPMEEQRLIQQAAEAGLSREQTQDLALRVMQFERLGMGGGAAASFASMFRAGGGAGGDVNKALGVTISEAMASGVSASRLPEYMERVQAATTQMAETGVTMDPSAVVNVATALRAASGGAEEFAGVRGVAAAATMQQAAARAAGGGGARGMQYLMLQAAGLGTMDPDTGRMIDLPEARMRLRRGQYDQGRVMNFFGGMGRSGLLASEEWGFMSAEQMSQLRPGAFGAALGGAEEIAGQRGAAGMWGLGQAAVQATSGAQRSVAGIERGELGAGQRNMWTYLRLRRGMQQLRNAVRPLATAAAGGVSSAVTWIAEQVEDIKKGELPLGGESKQFRRAPDEEVFKSPEEREKIRARRKKAAEKLEGTELFKGKTAMIQIEATPQLKRLLNFQAKMVPA